MATQTPVKLLFNMYFHVNSLILCVPKCTVFLFIEKIMPWDPSAVTVTHAYITLTGSVSSVVSPCSVVVNTLD